MIAQIVLLSGKQGSGKTTLAKEIYKQAKNKFRTYVEQLTFAEPLYLMHNYCIGILKSAGIERDIVKDGPLLQLLGTEWGRNTINQNIWVDVLIGRMKKIVTTKYQNAPSDLRVIFVISDCRFQNEFNALDTALRIRLECPREIRKERCEMWRENDNHPSEIDLDQTSIQEKFDMKFWTDKMDAVSIASLIHAQLDKNVWIEKRNNKHQGEVHV